MSDDGINKAFRRTEHGLLSLDPLNASEFLERHRLCVLYFGLVEPTTTSVLDDLKTARGAAGAWINTTKIDSAHAITSLIARYKEQIGWQTFTAIPSAYYLFISGHVVGHHAGNIEWENDKISLGLAAFLGLFTKASFHQAFSVAQSQASSRVVSHLTNVIDKFDRIQRQSRTAPNVNNSPPKEKLLAAYRSLDLFPPVTCAEIRTKKRDLLHKWHPDKAGGDPEKEALANERTREILSAADLLSKELACD
jgi:hypothetical protein